jgi:hypothetical protein
MGHSLTGQRPQADIVMLGSRLQFKILVEYNGCQEVAQKCASIFEIETKNYLAIWGPWGLPPGRMMAEQIGDFWQSADANRG